MWLCAGGDDCQCWGIEARCAGDSGAWAARCRTETSSNSHNAHDQCQRICPSAHDAAAVNWRDFSPPSPCYIRKQFCACIGGRFSSWRHIHNLCCSNASCCDYFTLTCSHFGIRGSSSRDCHSSEYWFRHWQGHSDKQRSNSQSEQSERFLFFIYCLISISSWQALCWKSESCPFSVNRKSPGLPLTSLLLFSSPCTPEIGTQLAKWLWVLQIHNCIHVAEKPHVHMFSYSRDVAHTEFEPSFWWTSSLQTEEWRSSVIFFHSSRTTVYICWKHCLLDAADVKLLEAH